ncbi:MAG: nucleotide exchange factor GrpE [Clostridia bacterium]|nr:nucleotide exchange factor GrpE [Clostridia bacterium]
MSDEIKDTVSEEALDSEAAETSERPEKDGKKKKKERELEAELLKYKEAAEKAEAALKESEDKYLRLLAEYDNFRKRTAKEKEGIYSDAYGNALTEILPIVDTLEMASGMSGDKVAEGVKMTLGQFKDTLTKLGIEEIPAEVGGEFNPELHNAVMSAENPELPSGSIAMVLRKGYKKGDKVYRYTMVSVVS